LENEFLEFGMHNKWRGKTKKKLEVGNIQFSYWNRSQSFQRSSFYY